MADPTDDMKEWLELYLHEKHSSVIGGLFRSWNQYKFGGSALLIAAKDVGERLARAKQILERFDESWEDWVASAHRAKVVPFDVEQAAQLIDFHEKGRCVSFEGWLGNPGDFVATLAIKDAPCEVLR